MTTLQGPAIYQQMLRESRQSGLPQAFKTDLTKHDRAWLYSHPAPPPFGWLLYSSGTHLVILDATSRRSLHATLHDVARFAQDDAGRARLFVWDGRSFTESPSIESWIHQLSEIDERARGLVPNARRAPDDEPAAEELILYLDNDARFSPMGTGQGRAILVNMMRRWRNGTYDHDRAPTGWSHVVEAAAKSYAKEFASPRSWARIFTPATRDMVAQALADRFVAEAQSGALDDLDASRR